jgi:K+-transporting ATPase KdpF subunit
VRSHLAPEEQTMFDYLVSGVVATLLLVYLGWAMFKPEKF